MLKELNNLLLILFIVTLPINTFGQKMKSDMELIYEAEFSNPEYVENHHSLPLPLKNFSFDTRGFLRFAFQTGIFLYQEILSRQLSAGCFYSPSCSHYSQALIIQYGTLQGILFSCDRLMRCNKLASIDFSPLRINPQTGKVEENISYYKSK